MHGYFRTFLCLVKLYLTYKRPGDLISGKIFSVSQWEIYYYFAKLAFKLTNICKSWCLSSLTNVHISTQDLGSFYTRNMNNASLTVYKALNIYIYWFCLSFPYRVLFSQASPDTSAEAPHRLRLVASSPPPSPNLPHLAPRRATKVKSRSSSSSRRLSDSYKDRCTWIPNTYCHFTKPTLFLYLRKKTQLSGVMPHYVQLLQ